LNSWVAENFLKTPKKQGVGEHKVKGRVRDKKFFIEAQKGTEKHKGVHLGVRGR